GSGRYRPLPSFPTRRSSDLLGGVVDEHRARLPQRRSDGAVQEHGRKDAHAEREERAQPERELGALRGEFGHVDRRVRALLDALEDRKSTRLNSSHVKISYAV